MDRIFSLRERRSYRSGRLLSCYRFSLGDIIISRDICIFCFKRKGNGTEKLFVLNVIGTVLKNLTK